MAARPVSAQTITVPNTVADAGEEFSAPFNDPSRIQVIYAASQFSAYSIPTLIRQIDFAVATPNLAGVPAFTYNFTSIRLDLSTPLQTVASLSTTFASNVGLNDTVVYNGALSGSSAGVPTFALNGAFDVVVNLSTPFLYIPGTNVLLDIVNSSAGAHFNTYADGDPNATITSQVFVDNTTTATTGTKQAFGIVAQFSTVPEPSTWVALGLGGLILAVLGRRTRRRSEA